MWFRNHKYQKRRITSRRYNLLPLLPSDPGGVCKELTVLFAVAKLGKVNLRTKAMFILFKLACCLRSNNSPKPQSIKICKDKMVLSLFIRRSSPRKQHHWFFAIHRALQLFLLLQYLFLYLQLKRNFQDLNQIYAGLFRP